MELVGLSPKGRLAGEYCRRKLTAAQVAEMRKTRAEKCLSYKDLGKRFGVTPTTAWRICKGEIWKNEPLTYAYQATEEELEQVTTLAAKGFGYKTIAKLLDVTPMSVYRLLQDDQNRGRE